MDSPTTFLLHWEPQYPVEQIQHALISWQLPEGIAKNNIFVALPQGYLLQASTALTPSGFMLGANDMANSSPNSFTNSVAAKLMQKLQAQFVLIGSAFKRHKMGETADSIREKVRTALSNNITPFLCFCKAENDAGGIQPAEMIKNELKDVLAGLSSDDIQRIRFVYDTAPESTSMAQITSESLQADYEACLQTLTDLCGNEAVNNIKILCAFPPYGELSKSITEKSPFAGFYFKMTDTTHLPQLSLINPRDAA